MKKVSIKESYNREFFRKLQELGCVRVNVKGDGRGNYHPCGTSGKQKRHHFSYPDELDAQVRLLNDELCAAPKTTVFI